MPPWGGPTQVRPIKPLRTDQQPDMNTVKELHDYVQTLAKSISQIGNNLEKIFGANFQTSSLTANSIATSRINFPVDGAGGIVIKYDEPSNTLQIFSNQNILIGASDTININSSTGDVRVNSASLGGYTGVVSTGTSTMTFENGLLKGVF